MKVLRHLSEIIKARYSVWSLFVYGEKQAVSSSIAKFAASRLGHTKSGNTRNLP